eukprot:365057-Chlamydomonas_euryale.AAC.1
MLARFGGRGGRPAGQPRRGECGEDTARGGHGRPAQRGALSLTLLRQVWCCWCALVGRGGVSSTAEREPGSGHSTAPRCGGPSARAKVLNKRNGERL